MNNGRFIFEIKEHDNALRAFALQLTHNGSDADDLYQDTAYKAIRYQHLYEPKTNLLAWLMTIMRNTFINDWRKRRRRQELGDRTVQGVVYASQPIDHNHGEGRITFQEVMAKLDELEEGLRKPFIMAYKGFKYEEIAAEMSLPLGTVKSRIHQARKLLKQKLKFLYQTHQIGDILR